MKALAEGDTLAAWLEQRPPELDRRAAFEALVDIVGSDRVGHSGDESGYVRVLSAESVRSLRIPYLFLAGLSEKAFPAPDREDRLYSEADYLRLIDAGLPLVARTERTREEMLLFYEAVTRATKRLYLSYPALDEAAQPLLPSPFLSEIEEAFGQDRIPRVERTDLSPIPSDDEPLCQSDFRVKAVATALEGNVALLAGLMQGRGERGRGERGLGTSVPSESALSPSPPLPSPFPRRRPGTDLPASRPRPFRPGRGHVAERGGTAPTWPTQFHPQHVFSATELERYASCPFRFFLERILKIEPLEDLALEFDVMERGRVVHDVLAAFHQQVNARLGRPGSPLELDEAEFDALLDAAIQKSLPPEPRNPVQAALREVDRRLVVEWLSQYRGQVEKYDAQWKDFSVPMAPELFEVSFGRGGEPSPSTDKPFEFVRQGADHPHLRPDRPHRHRHDRRPDRVQRARLQDGRHDQTHAREHRGRHDPATAALRHRRDGTAAGRPRRSSLAGRLLVRARRRLQAQAGAGDVRRRRRPNRIESRLGGHSRRAGRHRGRDWSNRCAPGDFPYAAPTTAAPAAARSAPSAESIKCAPWRRHGNRRRASESADVGVLTDQQRPQGGDRAGRVGRAVGRRRMRQDVRAYRAVSGGIGAAIERSIARKAARPSSRLGQLVAITFTERAAREMRDRIRKACRERLENCPEHAGRITGWGWCANWIRRGSARSIRSAARCCGRTPSRPASIRGSACSTRPRRPRCCSS